MSSPPAAAGSAVRIPASKTSTWNVDSSFGWRPPTRRPRAGSPEARLGGGFRAAGRCTPPQGFRQRQFQHCCPGTVTVSRHRLTGSHRMTTSTRHRGGSTRPGAWLIAASLSGTSIGGRWWSGATGGGRSRHRRWSASSLLRSAARACWPSPVTRSLASGCAGFSNPHQLALGNRRPASEAPWYSPTAPRAPCCTSSSVTS